MIEAPLPEPPAKPPGTFRVVHSADWHLGKSLGNMERLEEQALFLQWLEKLLIQTEADALVVAGDLFDTATPPQSAVKIYFEFVAALLKRHPRCQIIITSGNHDSASHLESPGSLLEQVGVKVVASLHLDQHGGLSSSHHVIPLPDKESPQVVIAAMPFLRERDLRTGEIGQEATSIAEDLRKGIAARYAELAKACAPWRGVPLLATGHLTALGASTSSSEREIHVGGLGTVSAEAFSSSFHYVALGHLHRPQAVGGKEHLRYSGSPIPLSFSEAADKKEVRLLDFSHGKLQNQHSVPVPLWRPLLTFRSDEKDLLAELARFTPPLSPLMPWVEVTVTRPSGTVDLCELVHRAAHGKPYQVLRILTERDQEMPRTLAESEEEAEALLASPEEVFALRLEESELSPSEREALATAFKELLDLHSERQREE